MIPMSKQLASWHFTKEQLKNSPSVADGFAAKDLLRFRYEGCTIIRDVAKRMKLGHKTMATAMLFYQRFYMLVSYKDFPIYPIALACLFVAGKAEETPKKARHIIRVAQGVLTTGQLRSFGDNPYEFLLNMESAVMSTLRFRFKVDHPFEFIVPYCRILKGIEKETLEKVMQSAWNFVHDSLFTTLCLQQHSEVVAIAIINLALHIAKVEVKDWVRRADGETNWWDHFVGHLAKETLDAICFELLTSYATKPGTASEDIESFKVLAKEFQATDAPNPSAQNAASSQAALQGVAPPPPPPPPPSAEPLAVVPNPQPPPPPSSRASPVHTEPITPSYLASLQRATEVHHSRQMHHYAGPAPYGQMYPYPSADPYGQMYPYSWADPYGQMYPYAGANPSRPMYQQPMASNIQPGFQHGYGRTYPPPPPPPPPSSSWAYPMHQAQAYARGAAFPPSTAYNMAPSSSSPPWAYPNYYYRQ